MKDSSLIQSVNDLLEQTKSIVNTSAVWSNRYNEGISSLRDEMSSPCVLAIAGKVKAGKSFLINALLGVDLAMTGTTETTATINVFKKGRPFSPKKPVLCQYVDGRKEWCTKEFLESLQGTSEASLKKTSEIDKLIFNIDDNPLLEDITLVDTPGIGAEVGEDGDSHQIQTDSYFKLRERHHQDTISLSNSADAIIYIFNTVPTETDRNFLNSLYDDGKGLTAINCIGVLSKIDKDLGQIDNIKKFENAFEKNIFSILPTSAALTRLMPDMRTASNVKNILRRGFNSDKYFNFAISAEKVFLLEKIPECTLTLEERKALLSELSKGAADVPWSVLSCIAKELYHSDDLTLTLQHLESISGVNNLKELINNHFFNRSRLLRCHKVLSELKRIVTSITYDEAYFETEYLARNKERFMQECKALAPETANILGKLIRQYIPSEEHFNKQKINLHNIKDKIEQLHAALSTINDCYIAFEKLNQAKDQFTESEIMELGALFSGKNISLDPMQRFKYWSAIYNCCEPNSIRQVVSRAAKNKYNSYIHDTKINSEH
jgi:hypothetical protein